MGNTKKYDLACLTSMGVRIMPTERIGILDSNVFHMQSTSAESNVLNVSASLGLNTLVMTKFVDKSPIASFIKGELRKRNINYEGVDVDQGGPWGYRHQINIADSGYGARAPRVWNDRSGEVGRTLSLDEFDLERILYKEGIRALHLSGLVAAMSHENTQCCVDLAKKAKETGAIISFDLNYRETFWKGREAELQEAFKRIAETADILIGNEEDYQLCLGLEGPDAGGEDLADNISRFKKMIETASGHYPNCKIFATTLREVISAGEHLWGAIVYSEGEFYVEEPRKIWVLDRIGGGDGFSAGLIYGVLKGFSVSDCMKFGWACGALAVTGIYDYASPADEKQVWDMYAGKARIIR